MAMQRLSSELRGVRVQAARAPKPWTGHRHEWQATERVKNGARLKVHVCLGHKDSHTGEPAPLIKAYDLEVINSALFAGQQEYEERGRR